MIKPIPADKLLDTAESILINDFYRRMRHLNEHFYGGQANRIIIENSRSGGCVYVDGCHAIDAGGQDLPLVLTEEAETAVRAFMKEQDVEDDDMWTWVADYIVAKQLRNWDVIYLWWPDAKDAPMPTLYIEGE